MIAVDVEQSGGRGNIAQFEFRRVLFEVMRSAFDDSGLDWDASLRKDLGDGVRAILPAGSPRSAVIYPLVHRLSVRLRDHNRLAGAATTIRLRIAVHAGDVLVGADGLVGWSLELLSRLLDAPALRTALSRAPETTTVALLVSAHVHDEIVRHGYPGIDPDTFHRVPVEVKETSAQAWLHVPGSTSVRSEPSAANVPTEPSTPASQVQNNAPRSGGVVFAAQGGPQTIYQKDLR